MSEREWYLGAMKKLLKTLGLIGIFGLGCVYGWVCCFRYNQQRIVTPMLRCIELLQKDPATAHRAPSSGSSLSR